MAEKLIVGCPLWDRSWILPTWFRHLERAVNKAGFDSGDVMTLFAGDHDSADFAEGVAQSWRRGWNVKTIDVIETHATPQYERQWQMDRYEHMAYLRNTLLAEVRRWEPGYYWSLDSDILVAESALELAVDALTNRDFAAVGQRCFMTPFGTECPSYAMLNNGGLLRPDAEGCFPVDVIMASKVMTAPAYGVDYRAHLQGEDIGWSIACREAGLVLGWDGRSVSKHVMERKQLDDVDQRAGF